MTRSDSTFGTQDLVLDVKTDFNPALVRLDSYEGFLDALCQDREYQKEAIRTVCRLLGGGQYKSTEDLAEENYSNNPLLSERYGSLDGLLTALPFPSKLSCSVDQATATGKSWVMYGIARILLAEGVVDRVLALCPSLTIESGLAVKFKKLSASRTLRDLIPQDAVFRNPDITDSSVTTGPGDICIENIDATYKHVRSSVRDSFLGKGDTTLVLNDETHHVFSPPTGQRAIKRWKEFLDSEEFDFRRIVGFSGTCFIGNFYFADVVARYSLRQAMEDGRVKDVRYVSKDESISQEERFQKYLQLHRENQSKYPTRKPLSIVVTARVQGAQTLAEEFVDFLSRESRITKARASEKVLVVTSASEHRANVARLPYVDRTDDAVEWIFSVSMLTEGWDVQNVFQIVPHEKRAFASKLLIAQVLGRGLRVPAGLSRPAVRVFNHASWSAEIADLVAEVLEQERRLHSYPISVGDHRKCHFELHQLTYKTLTTDQHITPRNGNGQMQLFKRGFINFESQPEELERKTIFSGALDAKEYVLTTTVHYTAHTVDDVVQRLSARLKSIDAEGDTTYAQEYPRKKLRKIIDASLKRIRETRGLVTEQNLQHAYRALGTTQRRLAKTVRLELDPQQLFKVSTKTVKSRSVALTSLRKEATVFYDSESLEASQDIDRRVLEELIDEDSPYPKRAVCLVENKYWFRSPVNVVLATHEPERRFMRALFEPANAQKLQAWIKSPDVGFYEIAYSWRKGDHSKQGKFNPDLFLKLTGSKVILVVELKEDGDTTDENRAKLKFATEHFDRINALQRTSKYYMKFLSPESYDAFFRALQKDESRNFVSALQASLLD